jgi:hypothetical protein
VTQKTWVDDTPYEWLERNLRRLATTMLIGAIYDVTLGVLGLFFPRWMTSLTGIAMPSDRFYFLFWPMTHLVFASFYVLAWMDIKRNIVIVTGAIIARTLYTVFVLASIGMLGIRPVWAIPGAISLGLAILHYVLLRLSDFRFWEVFSQAGNPPGTTPHMRR